MLAHTWLGHRARLVVAAALVVAGLLAPPSVHFAYAQTITVTTTAEAPGASGDCTLGEAIQAANSNAPVDACPPGTTSDVIVLAPGATYTLTTASTSDNSAFLISSNITLQGHEARLAHDALAGTLRFFTMTASSSLTLINLTLVGGVAQGANGQDGPVDGVSGTKGDDAFGGAINSAGGDVMLDGVTFQGNRALGGLGGSGHSGSNSSFGAKGGGANGGAIYSAGKVFLQGAGGFFTGNQALGGRGGNGGILTTDAGQGGDAIGGAVDSSELAAIAAALSAEDNLAQGGDGGNGASKGSGGNGRGGALQTGSTFLDGATFINNRAQGGHAGDSLLSNPFMFGGYAAGGAVYTSGLAASHSRFISNTAQGGAGPTGGAAYAGGLYVALDLLPTGLQNTQILNNTAAGGPGSDPNGKGGDANGGGAYLSGGTLPVNQSALVGNIAQAGEDPGAALVAQAMGGGLFTIKATIVNVTTIMTNTTIALNRADQGGGLEGQSSNFTLVHVTVYSNTASASGGGLGGLTTSITLRNSLVADNTGGNCDATITAEGNNLQYPGSSCAAVPIADPLLSPVADNGGGTLTAALKPGSPALDVGAPAFCPPTDQRGQPRPFGAGCDLGAYERGFHLWLPLTRR